MIVILCTLACVSFAQDIVQQSEDNESIARAQLGIVTQYVNVSQWTPEGTKYKIQAQDFIRGGNPLQGCSEKLLFGLYDWDCYKGNRKLGHYTHKTQCKTYCLSTQLMVPNIKKIVCKCKKKLGVCNWEGRVKRGKKMKNPDLKCVTQSVTAYWSYWSSWSAYTSCNRACGPGQRIRQQKRQCVNGVMGENDNCPLHGNIKFEYDACNNNCIDPPEVRVVAETVNDMNFGIKWTVHNVNIPDINHFQVEVFEKIVEWGQKSYQVANFDMINPKLRDINVWREVKPNTRYDVYVSMRDARSRPISEIAKITVLTISSRFEYDESEICKVDWPTTTKDEMVSSCDHMTTVPAGHRCYTYCKDDWKKVRGDLYLVCMAGKWRGAMPTCEKRGWRCNFNFETYCPGCVRPDHCCEHIENEGSIDYVCKKGYLMPASNHHSDNGLARGLMKKLTSDQPSCFSIRPKRRDCSKIHLVKIIALYENNNDSKRKERILVDVATDPHWIEACRDEEDYDVEVMDIKPEHDFDTVRIVFEHYLDRNDANLGYDMWFDDFQHGYGRCKTMRCGEFAPPLLKGAGAAYGHDVGEPNTCSDGDKVGSKCAMNCPTTHPVHHFSHYWQEINCLPGGFWSQDLYTYYTGYCSAPACNFFDVVPPENGWYSCTAQGYEGSICTFGCNSVDFKLQDKDPYRIQCQSGMWEPVGGSKKFVQGKVHPKCVFNHVFARREKKITKLLNPLHAMKREYRELSGADFPSELRHKQTEYNVQLVKRRFSMNDATKAIDFERIFNSEMKVVDFESDSEVFEG